MRQKVDELLRKDDDFRYELIASGYRKTGVFLAKGHVSRDEGITVRVTAFPEYAKKILEIAKPILEEKKVTHKFVRSAESLQNDMTGTQEGKFLTIYMDNNEQAVEIAEELDRALADKNLHGPKIKDKGEFPLPDGKSGLVSYVYKGFTKDEIRDQNGNEILHERGQREWPSWIEDPFKKKSGNAIPEYARHLVTTVCSILVLFAGYLRKKKNKIVKRIKKRFGHKKLRTEGNDS